MNQRAQIIPALRYNDATRAVDWLCAAFGFQPHLVVHGKDGSLEHAQLVFDNGMVMVGPMRDDAFGHWIKPAQTTIMNTQCAYMIVGDVDAHHARAVATGARIVMPLKDEGYGGKGYACLDFEGVLWSFGSYDPWATPA